MMKRFFGPRREQPDEPLRTHPSTGLTLAQEEALHLLMEECGEAIQAAAKILRHGLVAQDASNPEAVVEYNNGAHLVRELGHVLAATHICHLLGMVDGTVHAASKEKLEKVQHYLHHIRLVNTGETK